MTTFSKNFLYVILVTLFCAPLSAAQTDKQIIRMGINQNIFSGLSQGDAKLAMQQIIKLAGFENYEMITSFLPDEEAFFAAIKNKEVDFFPILTHQYLELQKSVVMVPSAAPITNGDAPYIKFVLLTADLDLELKDVANKTLLIDHSRSHGLERLWLETIAMEAGLGRIENVFTDIAEVDKPNKAILPTFFKKTDLCIVSRQNWDLLSELNPQLRTKLKVVSESKPLLTMVLAFRKDFDPAAQKRFSEQVIRVHETVPGKQILTLSKTKEIARFKDEWMDSITELTKRNAALKQALESSKETAP